MILSPIALFAWKILFDKRLWSLYGLGLIYLFKYQKFPFMSPSTRATHPRPQGLAAARDPYFSPRNRVKKGSGDENGARHCLCDIGYSYTFHTIPTVINFHKPGWKVELYVKIYKNNLKIWSKGLYRIHALHRTFIETLMQGVTFGKESVTVS